MKRPTRKSRRAIVRGSGAADGAALVKTMGTANKPNIVLIVLDCLRAKSVSHLGLGGRARCANLEQAGKRGRSIARAVAPSNWTVPSHTSILRGIYPFDSNAKGSNGAVGAPSLPPTLGEALKTRGYEACVFTEQEALTEATALLDGYTVRYSPELLGQGRGGNRRPRKQFAGLSSIFSQDSFRRISRRLPIMLAPVVLADRTIQKRYKRRVSKQSSIAGSVAEWLETRDRSRPFHVVINVVDSHEPYDLGYSDSPLSWIKWIAARAPRLLLLLDDRLRDSVPWELVRGDTANLLSKRIKNWVAFSKFSSAQERRTTPCSS